MKTPIEPQTSFASEARRKYVNRETGKPENHDRAWAGEIRLPAGGRVWAAIVADGCGGDSRGTQVAEACVAAFRAAVAGSSAAELCDIVRAKAWAARWGDALQATIVNGPLKGGNSTLAAAVAVRDPASPAAVSLLLVNVGDSPMFLYSGPELRALNVTPDEPEDNPNAGAGGNGLRRAIGLPATGAFPLFDVAIRRLPADAGPCGVAVFSDGVTDYTKVAVQGGRKTLRNLKLLNPSDFRRVLADGSPFADRAAAILAVSLATARARGIPETQLDNSSVALLGFGLDRKIRVPGVRPVDRRRSALFVTAVAAAFVAIGSFVAALWPRGPNEEETQGPGPIPPPFRTNMVYRPMLPPVPVPANAAETNHPADPVVPIKPTPGPLPTNALSAVDNPAASAVPAGTAGSVPTNPPPSTGIPGGTKAGNSPQPPVPPAPTDVAPLKPALSPESRPAAVPEDAPAAVVAGKTPEWGLIGNSTKQDLVVEGLGVDGGEKVLPVGIQENVPLPESGSIEFSVWPAEECRGCWNAVKVVVSKERPEFNIKDTPARKPDPIWTAPPTIRGQKAKVKRAPDGSRKDEEIPKDGKMSFKPHGTNVIFVSNKKMRFTIETGHCGDDPVVLTNPVETVEFTLPFANRGPRSVAVKFPHSTKERYVVPPWSTTNLSVAIPVSQGKKSVERTYVVEDDFLKSCETNFVTIKRAGAGETTVEWSAPMSEETKKLLEVREREKEVKTLFERLRNYSCDEKKEDREGIQRILNAKRSFAVLSALAEAEGSENRYALLRWLRERIPEEGFPLKLDIIENWDRIEEIWNEMADSTGKTDVSSVQKGNNEPVGKTARNGDGGAEAPSVPAGWVDYRIQKGDTLWTIATKRLVSESSNREIQDLKDKIKRVNDIPDPDDIKPGVIIKVPPKPSSKDGAADSVTLPEGTSPD